jgi:RimJ/RimL family protein N-acetyltransferase/broad-specificity NMP kinase
MWEWEKGPVTIETARKAIHSMQENHNKNRFGHIHHLCFAIFEPENDRIIGWCGLDGQCVPGQIVIFYSIDSAYQNKGYATRCASKLLEYAFEDLGIDCVYGGCDKGNIASRRVMEKIGMKKDSTDESGDPSFYIDKEIYNNFISAEMNAAKVSPKLIIVSGSPCVGKTAAANCLFELLDNSAYCDGDWMWCVNPFSIDDPRLRNGDKNMSFVISTYLNSDFDYVIFSSVVVMYESSREAILRDITAKGYEIIGFTLTCSEKTLIERHKSRGDDTEVSFEWLRLEPYPNDYVINTDGKTAEQIAVEMKNIIDHRVFFQRNTSGANPNSSVHCSTNVQPNLR